MATNCPKRDYMDAPDIKWNNGIPNFDLVDQKYMKERTLSHQEGSLEKLVENLVKTWEMESSHKANTEDWETVDRQNFSISCNGGRKFGLKDNIALGNYNILLDDCPLYNARQHTNATSQALFRNAFPGGYAWELLEVQSGPPVVSFTWHHWGTREGAYGEVQPNGDKMDLYGSCVVRVDENLKIQSIEVYYDPNPTMAKLTGFKAAADGCPVLK